MKKLITIIVIIIFVQNVIAQDIITKKNGKKIETIIEEVGEKIKYRNYYSANLQFYEININDVASILYEDGTFIEYSNVTDMPKEKYEQKKYDNKEVFRKYEIGQSIRKRGTTLLATGICTSVVGITFLIMANYGIAPIAFTIIGGAAVATSPFLLTFGIAYSIIGKVRMMDNDITLLKNEKSSLNMAIYGNGVGLKLNF